jgi:hypothetical protein
MEYSTRQFILLLTKISEAFEKHNGAVDQIRKTYNQDTKTHKETVEKLLAAHNKSEGNRSANEIRQCNIQNSNRWAAWITTLATTGAVIAATWYGCTTRRMWQEMQEQTRIQRNTAINQQRAWVGLDVPITLDAIGYSPTAINIAGHYTIENFGHGPALKVIQFGNCVDLDATMEVQQQEAKSYCDAAVNFTNGTVPVGGELKQPPPFGYTLFPGQSHTEPIQFTGKLPSKMATFMRFIGCVAYLDQFKITHWTRFCMERKPGTPATPAGKVPKLDFCAMYNDTDEPKPN